ncbi:transcriptional regulatory protein Pro-1 [Neurospora intermedia]|uniref:Transcriptional regulatory protein Pro-1 n=1 Tax=Neurospora intermedia TaxID=5142 RepID=A0ABR3DQW9_NEUIN
MSTQSPNHHEDITKTSSVNMTTTTTTTKTKAAAKAGTNAAPKQKTQMHRRSRTGCYTCRLRRKKCDEGSPMCTACKHLGLCCEYKRPMWWSNNDARRKQKDEIKMIIKRKKLSEKSSHTIQTSINTPPGLSHSLPTSATFSDPLDRNRSASIDSHFGFNFNSPQHGQDFAAFATPQIHVNGEYMFPPFSPYEIDMKTERQIFINDIPTLRESTISTFSTYQTPPPPGTILPSFPLEGEWTEQVFSERRESLTEETFNANFFDFACDPAMASSQVAIELDDGDQKLLDHFVQHVLPTIFPILESNQHGSISSELVLPSLANNKGYLHCCLSIAAQHFKSTMGIQNEEIDSDIMRHRYATITWLCEALNRDENHRPILDATLGLIFFQCIVGRPEDTLPDIPWHQHFQAVVSLVQKLDLAGLVSDITKPLAHTPFNMTLTSWIDILGATMLGSSPLFAHTYRNKHLSINNHSLGLRELMGCEDRVMYLISEIACLESLKNQGMDDITLCQHVRGLGDEISNTEVNEGTLVEPYNANGTLSPKQLSKNITAAFRLAARIYLCSLVPGFYPAQPSCMGLVEKLTAVLQLIPSGVNGYDRSLTWVYLIGGSVSVPGSSFRDFFENRVAQLGDVANSGSFGRMTVLLREVWLQYEAILAAAEAAAGTSSLSSETPQQQQQVNAHYVRWREVMQIKGWDYLLI